MAKDLRMIRTQKKMKVGQLAGKTGIPAKQIVAYEKGEFIPLADRERLARVLFVNASDINPQSTPPPKAKKKEKPTRAKSKPKPTAAQSDPSPSSQQQMARPTQITHLIQIAANLGQTREDLETAVGKPMSAWTLQEAREQLHHYETQLTAQKENRPPGTRRSRSDVPEAVDTFELNYLQARQEAGDRLTLTLFDGSEKNGRLVGFSPYTLVIEDADGAEVAIHKLAIAYYTVTAQGGEDESG